MIFTKEQVRNMCEKIAPDFGFDPKLIYVICLQEGGRNTKDEFAPDIARLEQGFYRKYVEKQQILATTSEVLLAASYGIMQMMGESLRLAGYFQWYFMRQTPEKQKFLGKSLSQIAIPTAIDEYCENLEYMIKWGVSWLDIKRKLAKGDERLMLTYWNGSSLYPDEIYKKLRTIDG